jgi:hypothetical protein
MINPPLRPPRPLLGLRRHKRTSLPARLTLRHSYLQRQQNRPTDLSSTPETENGDGKRNKNVPEVSRSSTDVSSPLGCRCVSLRECEDSAPERAPKRLRFRPAWLRVRWRVCGLVGRKGGDGWVDGWMSMLGRGAREGWKGEMRGMQQTYTRARLRMALLRLCFYFALLLGGFADLGCHFGGTGTMVFVALIKWMGWNGSISSRVAHRQVTS